MARDGRVDAPCLLRGSALSEVGAVVQAHGRGKAYQPIDRGLPQAEENRHQRICETADHGVEGVGHDPAVDAFNAVDPSGRLPSRLAQATPRINAPPALDPAMRDVAF